MDKNLKSFYRVDNIICVGTPSKQSLRNFNKTFSGRYFVK